MLYLFNSAYRPKYSLNVLNTLFLDTGCINEYRYTYDGKQSNVDPNITGAKGSLCEKQAMIVFIDRFHREGFFFHPIRLATYIEHQVRGDQVYFRVKLGDFIYPRKPEDFQGIFRSTLGNEKLPHSTASDPERKAEGFFALCGTNVSNGAQYIRGEDAWNKAVESIAQTKAFAGKKTVFIRASLWTRNGKRRQVTPHFAQTSSYYRLERGKGYTLQLYYRFPMQDINREAATTLSVQMPTHLMNFVGPAKIHVDSRNCTEYSELTIKNFPEERDGAISLALEGSDAKQEADAEKALLAGSSLTVRVAEAKSFWPLTIVLLLAYCLLGVFVGTDFDKLLVPLNAAKQLTAVQGATKVVLVYVLNNWLLVKCTSAFLQAAALFGLFKLLGKKIL